MAKSLLCPALGIRKNNPGGKKSTLGNTAVHLLRKLSNEEWARLIKELGRYALSISRRLRWRTENPYELPGGETVDSIVSKALKMVLTGAFEGSDIGGPKRDVRRWDPQKSPDLKKYLMNVIKSLLNHLATSEENTKFSRVPNGHSEDGTPWETGFRDHTADNEWLGRPARNPEEILLDKEAVAINDRALEMLFAESRSDLALTKVLLAMSRGRRTPSEISKDTELSVIEVYSAMKRLDRKAAIVRRELSKSSLVNNVSNERGW